MRGLETVGVGFAFGIGALLALSVVKALSPRREKPAVPLNPPPDTTASNGTLSGDWQQGWSIDDEIFDNSPYAALPTGANLQCANPEIVGALYVKADPSNEINGYSYVPGKTRYAAILTTQDADVRKTVCCT